MKKIQMYRFVNPKLKSDWESESEAELEVESKSDTELKAKLKSDFDFEESFYFQSSYFSYFK